MKIYLAARYSRHPECREIAADLHSMGHEVVSRWINGGHEMTKEGSTEAAQIERARFALEDLEDLMSSDCVVSLTEMPRSTNSRGGRHIEFGVALALGKRLIVVGHRESVFHCLPQIEFHPSWPWAKLALEKEL